MSGKEMNGMQIGKGNVFDEMQDFNKRAVGYLPGYIDFLAVPHFKRPWPNHLTHISERPYANPKENGAPMPRLISGVI